MDLSSWSLTCKTGTLSLVVLGYCYMSQHESTVGVALEINIQVKDKLIYRPVSIGL